MKISSVAIMCLILCGCSQEVSKTFSTYSEATRAGAFERKWLPRFLPTSARNIEVRGNEELELFAGAFLLSQGDLNKVSSQLEPYPEDPLGTVSGRDQHLAVYIHAKKAEGLCAGVVYEEPFMWVLTCSSADLRCTYQRRIESANKRLQPIGREDAPSG